MAAAKQVKRADIRAFVGTTGSGKGVGINEHLGTLTLSRLIVFDPMHEYGDRGQVVATVEALITAMKKPTFRVVWQPDDETDYESKPFKADFARFCRAAFLVGNLVMLVEELELVTRPSWAPAAWRNCTKRGRHVGLVILAATQRPADADKAFWSSCSYIRCHALREEGDIDRMAKSLKVPYEQIDKLQTVELSASKTSITYYEKDFGKGISGEKTIVLGR
jgi:hypothetical protein